MNAALSVSHVSYRYPDGRNAVTDVTFTVDEGEAVGLIGPNRAGKTTLFLLVTGLLSPEQGEISVFGKSYTDEDDREVRRRLGFVPQGTEDQLFSATLFDDVAFGPLNFGVPREAVRARVTEALRKVGLSGYEERVPHHLSSGERRRAALATVLSYEPDLLVLDEPSNDLDPRGRSELVGLLRATDQGRIVASCDFEFILRTCDRVLVLDAGRVIADWATADILCDRALLEAHGLEVPLGLRGCSPAQVRELLEAEG